jgi:hypothetical protein
VVEQATRRGDHDSHATTQGAVLCGEPDAAIDRG